MRFIWLITLIFLPAVAMAQSEDADRGYLTNLIESNLSGDDRTVTITGFEGALSSEARIAQMTIADAEGVWLTLEDVVLQWNRTALLRGAINVQQLRAGRIIVDRAPIADESGPSPEAQPFALPELPVSVTLGVLQIDQIELAESFLGEPVVVSLSGSAALAGGEGQADVLATRLDGKEGIFQIDGSYSNVSNVLAILLNLEEGPDGIAARLLDLPDRPSVQLTVEGDAPLDDFSATLALATDGQDRLSGRFGVANADGQQQVRLDVGGDISALFAEEYQEFFGTDAQLEMALNRSDDGRIDIPRLALLAGRVSLDGRVQIAPQGWPEVIRITGGIAAQGDEPVLLPLSGPRTFVDDVTLAVNYDASISDDWDMDITVNGLTRPGLVIDRLGLRGGGLLRSGEGAAAGRFTADLDYGAEGLQLDDTGAAEAFGDGVTGTLSLERIEGNPTEISNLTLTGAGVDLQGDALIAGPSAGFQTDANVAVQVAGLQRFSTLVGQDLGGDASFDITADLTPLDGLFNVMLDGVTTDLRVGIAEADAVLAGEGTLAANLVRDTAGTRLERFAVTTDAADVTAGVSLTSTGSEADITASLRDLGLVLPDIEGPVATTGRVTMSDTGQISFDLSGTAPAASYQTNGTIVPAPEGGQVINVDLAADVTDLSRYAGVAGRPLAGAAALNIDGVASSDGARFTLDVSAETQDLVTGLDPLDPLLAGAGELAVAMERTGETSLRLSDLSMQTPTLDLRGSADLQLEGPNTADLALRIPDASVIDGSLSGPLALTLNASPTPTGETGTVLQITGPGTDLRLDATVAGADADYAVTGDLAAQVANLSAYAGVIGQPLRGSIDLTASGNLLPDLSAFDARVNLRSEDLGIGNPTADALLAGTGRINADIGQTDGVLAVRTLEISTPQLSVVGALNGNAGIGQGRFNASLRDIGLLTDQISGPVRATGSASLDDGGNWGIDATGTGPGGLTAQVRGDVAQSGQLDLAINGSAPLGLANAVLEPRRLSGTANFDLLAQGDPGLDGLSGQVTFANGRLADPGLAQALSGITGSVGLSNGTAQINLQSSVEAGGAISINGPIGLSGVNTADVTVQLTDVVLQDPELYRTTIGGTVSLQGPLQGGARINGQLALGQTDVQVPSSSISPLGSLPDVVHLQPEPDVRQTLLRAGLLPSGAEVDGGGGGGAAFPLNIVIDAPSRIFIRGRGLDAELGGQLTIGGTSDNVIPVGRFELLRGRIDILSQRFDLTEGSASLQGDFEPYIRLVASTESAGGTQINIIVEGPASEPEVTFQSVPDLPQDEVLSQLIFGRDLQSISPLQAVQLASAISTLAGRGGGGVMDQLRENLGLDDFDVTTDEDGNAAVRAGRYLSENVYTDVTVSSSGNTEINLNLDVTDEIVARGGVDQDGGTSVGVFFERDY
ncbi:MULTISPECIES: translocation/assembly module TamB domain-containing protein [unclassified Yoonia]|uniref:translocation/assembly module TamB domain-containing protein n=1 Tax=unclassified Yoonia TaxID=2629118 RepID=UPI002B0028C2|nr:MULTISPECIES: translocation/assembly module TamB domain-containing protein [unclassified Yoonia]